MKQNILFVVYIVKRFKENICGWKNIDRSEVKKSHRCDDYIKKTVTMIEVTSCTHMR